jgi:NADH/NAD ratio-sensing transcriptional regulator Rex
MKLAKFTKSPAERKRYQIDYSEWLDTGELVQSVVFTVSPSTGTTPLEIDAFLIGTPATDVEFFANLGDDGIGYTVNVVMTTDGGQIKEDQVLFSVKGA